MLCMGDCTIELILNLRLRMHSGQEVFENKPQFQHVSCICKSHLKQQKSPTADRLLGFGKFLPLGLIYPPSSPIASTGHPSMAS